MHKSELFKLALWHTYLASSSLSKAGKYKVAHKKLWNKCKKSYCCLHSEHNCSALKACELKNGFLKGNSKE